MRLSGCQETASWPSAVWGENSGLIWTPAAERSVGGAWKSERTNRPEEKLLCFHQTSCGCVWLPPSYDSHPLIVVTVERRRSVCLEQASISKQMVLRNQQYGWKWFGAVFNRPHTHPCTGSSAAVCLVLPVQPDLVKLLLLLVHWCINIWSSTYQYSEHRICCVCIYICIVNLVVYIFCFLKHWINTICNSICGSLAQVFSIIWAN